MVSSNSSISYQRQVKEGNHATPQDAQIVALKAEVVELKNKLTLQETHQNFDPELVKLLLQNNIRYAEENNNQHIVAMKAAMEAINISELEKKTNDELSLIKEELEHFKRQLYRHQVFEDTVKDVAALRDEVVQQLKEVKGRDCEELNSMIKSAESTGKRDEFQQTQEDLRIIKQELIQVKAQLKETENVSKLQQELASLKKSLELEMRNSPGMSKDEMIALKSAIKTIDQRNIRGKDFDQLSVIHRDVQALKAGIKETERQDFDEELSVLKKKVAALVAMSEAQGNSEITELNEAIDSLSSRRIKVVKSIEDGEMEFSELEQLRRRANDQKEVQKIQKELAAIKKSIKSEIMESKEKNREGLEALCVTLGNLQAGDTGLPDSTFQELTKEMKKLKEEVEDQNRVDRKLEKLKQEVTEKIKDLGIDDDERENLSAFKHAVDAVAAFEANDDSETMMEDFTSVHGSIRDLKTNVKSSIDLEAINEALQQKLKMTDSASQRQLEEILDVVDKLDMKSLAGKSRRGAELNKELEATRHAVKSSELFRTISRLETTLNSGHSRFSRTLINHFRNQIDCIKRDGDNKSVGGIEQSLIKARKLYSELMEKIEGKGGKKGLRRFLRKLVGNQQDYKTRPPRVPVTSTTNNKRSKKESERETKTKVSASPLVIYQGFEEEEEMDPPSKLTNALKSSNISAVQENENAVHAADKESEKREQSNNAIQNQKDAPSIRSKLSLRSATSNKHSTFTRQESRIRVGREKVGGDCEKEISGTTKKNTPINTSENYSYRDTESATQDDVEETSSPKEENSTPREKEFIRSPGHVRIRSVKEASIDRYSIILAEEASDSSDDFEGSSKKEITFDLPTSGESHEDGMFVDLSHVSVSMVNPNEHGELDIETSVDMHSFENSPRHSLPLVMSI